LTTLIQNSDSSTLIYKYSDVLPCLINSQSVSETVRFICAHWVQEGNQTTCHLDLAFNIIPQYKSAGLAVFVSLF